MDESQTLHVVIGLGPLGRAVTTELVGRRIPARALTRHKVADPWRTG
jgi:hypothetical protein